MIAISEKSPSDSCSIDRIRCFDFPKLYSSKVLDEYSWIRYCLALFRPPIPSLYNKNKHLGWIQFWEVKTPYLDWPYHFGIDLEPDGIAFGVPNRSENVKLVRFRLIQIWLYFSVCYTEKLFCNINDTFERIFEILVNWNISTGILTRIAQAILVTIPIKMCQFTRHHGGQLRAPVNTIVLWLSMFPPWCQET